MLCWSKLTGDGGCLGWDRDRWQGWPAEIGQAVFSSSTNHAAFADPDAVSGPGVSLKDPAVVRRASDVLGHVLEFIAATRLEVCRNGVAGTDLERGRLAAEFELVGRCAFLLASELRRLECGRGSGAGAGAVLARSPED